MLTGQMASMLTELTKQVIIKVLKLPILSQVNPPRIRPTAVAAPNPPTKPAPVDADRPIELANSGKKNGGTKRAKTPTAPAMVSVRKGTFFKSDQSNRESVPVVARSFNNRVHGIPVAMIRIPRTRNVHSSPNLSMSACAARGSTVAPTPPPALTTPFAIPSFELNHWSGRLFVAVYSSDVPTPTSNPAMQNSPPRWSSVKLVAINPTPNTVVAARAVYRTPKDLITLIEAMPKATMQAIYRLPTKVMVRTFVFKLGDFRMAVCRTPQAVV